MSELLESITPDQFNELIAYDKIEPIGPTPIFRLLIFIATCLANQNNDKESETTTMEEIAEWAGLPKKDFEAGKTEKFVAPEVASRMFRR